MQQIRYELSRNVLAMLVAQLTCAFLLHINRNQLSFGRGGAEHFLPSLNLNPLVAILSSSYRELETILTFKLVDEYLGTSNGHFV